MLLHNVIRQVAQSRAHPDGIVFRRPCNQGRSKIRENLVDLDVAFPAGIFKGPASPAAIIYAERLQNGNRGGMLLHDIANSLCTIDWHNLLCFKLDWLGGRSQ